MFLMYCNKLNWNFSLVLINWYIWVKFRVIFGVVLFFFDGVGVGIFEIILKIVVL